MDCGLDRALQRTGLWSGPYVYWSRSWKRDRGPECIVDKSGPWTEVDWSGLWTAVNKSEPLHRGLYVKLNMSVPTQRDCPQGCQAIKNRPDTI